MGPVKTVVEITMTLLNANLLWLSKAKVDLLYSIQKGFNNKQIYHFIFLFFKKDTSFVITATWRQTWPINHTVWSQEPPQLTWAKINHSVLLLGRVPFGNGGKGESQELKVSLSQALSHCQNHSYCCRHSLFQDRMNYFTTVDVSADLKFFL